MPDLANVDPRILARREEHVADWQAFCRIPTIAGDLEAIETAATWLEQRLEPLMDSVVRYDIPEYGPVVVGFRRGLSERTLLLYNHYDVQPDGDPAQWVSGAFDAEIRDGAMYARGACDDKADVTSRLAALELWQEEHPEGLPFSIIYMADPCEEIGSPGLDTVLAEGHVLVECPITFHQRVGTSKGGNINNLRGLSVGLRMISGILFGWKHLAR